LLRGPRSTGTDGYGMANQTSRISLLKNVTHRDKECRKTSANGSTCE